MIAAGRATGLQAMAEYTDPELRERLKQEIQEGDRGGKPGQWSARKAQLLVQEYEKAGGGYTGPKDDRQKHLEQWGEQDWQTREGDADAGHGDKRYLPKQAWELLSEREQRETDTRKRGADHQHVANTEPAKAARKAVELQHMKADEARSFVKTLSSKVELDKAAKAERAGGSRKTVLEAIDARREQL
jgi:hypothetical protein